jgi:hypothetical protein
MRGIPCVCTLLLACTNTGEIVGPSTDDQQQDSHPQEGLEVADSAGEAGEPGDDRGGEPGGGYAQSAGPYFKQPMFWNEVVAGRPKAGNSDAIIAALAGAGGWGNNGRFTIDFTFDVLTADAATPKRAFTKTSEHIAPDCDDAPMPVPAGGNVEGNPGYACNNGGDCHLIVHDPVAGTLHELYRASITGQSFRGGCLAVWNTNAVYGDKLRGEQCTSADAAGFPIAPLLFSADEVAAGEIAHAIRFVLPNNRVKRGYVRPATHGTSTTGGTNAPPYGVHFRLRADFPVHTLPSQGARVVARALQKYGMYHADGGQVALTAQSDRHTSAKWAGLLAPHDLNALAVSDFEVIDHGPMIQLTYACAR